MSGYLDVKFPSRSSRSFNPFKTWKKQWCILRPSPTENGGVIAMHSSCHAIANTSIRLLPGCTVSRTKSRTHSFAFGIFLPGEYHKPHLLLASYSEPEANGWIHKIRAVVNGKKHFGRDIFKNTYSVSLVESVLKGDSDSVVECNLTLTPQGVKISSGNGQELTIAWNNIVDVRVDVEKKNKACIVITNSGPDGEWNEIKMWNSKIVELIHALKEGRASNTLATTKRLSRSEGDLETCTKSSGEKEDAGDGGPRISWNSSVLSEVSVDDSDLSLAKDTVSGQLLRCEGAFDLHPTIQPKPCYNYMSKLSHFAESLSDRRSLVSIASGIYEEIPDLPETNDANKGIDTVDGVLPKKDILMHLEENTYESVADCIYATMRRTGKKNPPPLPPRVPLSALKMNPSWSSSVTDDRILDSSVTRHISLGEIPNCCTTKTEDYLEGTKTLPKPDKQKPAFNVFRKRIKSESRAPTVEKTETRLKDKTDTENKKKKFDFASSSKKDIFKNLKSKNFMKNFKLSSSNLSKIGETKSCECLDTEAEPVQTNRCSKSVECLEQNRLDTENKCDTSLSTCCSSFNEEGQDLSMVYNEKDQENLSLPQDIVELILKGRDDLAELKLRHMEAVENDYMPMSPIGLNQPLEQHYTVMHSPSTRPVCTTTN